MTPPDDGGARPGLRREALLLWTHDVRSPLAALVANLHHVREVVPAGVGADTAEVVGECLALCSVLERYVTNLELLHQARVGRGAARVRLRDVAMEVARRAAPHAVMTEHRIDVVVRGVDEPFVVADATLLRVALENLVSSAMEQAPPGSIQLVVEMREGDGVIAIVDPGEPWTEGQVDGLTIDRADPQQRLAGGRDGRGLGLPAAAVAARAGGARLVLDDHAESGARLTVRAPLAPPSGEGSP